MKLVGGNNGSAIPGAVDAAAGPMAPSVPASRLQTVTVHIPLINNPIWFGIRLPVSFLKIWRTIRELQAHSTGLKMSLGLGWCAEDNIWDPHLCIDFDVELSLDMQSFLSWWKVELKDRFVQRSIYLRSSSPVTWM